MGGIDRVGVVVPAKNEERLLPACLAGLLAAARQIREPVTVVVVLDSCSDRSAAAVEAARQHSHDVTVKAVMIDANSVGTARRAGMAYLIDHYEPLRTEGLWLATTDADSIVPPHWLEAQLAHAALGAQVVVGTITVADWRDRTMVVRERAVADYTAAAHRHIHGANLSFTATAYLAAGGFPPRAHDEDVTLVQAFTRAREPIAWAVDLPVATSARRQARAPFGFASYLTDLESDTNAP